MDDDTNGTEASIRLETRSPTVGFDNLVSFDSLYRRLESLLPRFDPDIRAKLRQRHGSVLAEPDSTLLLFGPPGCEKAAAAEAVATEMEMSQYLDMDILFLI